MRPQRLAGAGVIGGALLLGACTSNPSQPAGATNAISNTADPSAAPTNSVQPVDDSTNFCRALDEAGVANTAALQQSSDPSTMLSTLDALVSKAPDDIAADFAIFDQVEHATLDPSAPSTHVDLTNPGTRDAITHVGTYLRDSCHLT
jgi:hypothetical protein